MWLAAAFFVASASARIVSVSPTLTELVYALGAGPDLVADTRFCDYPEAAKALPKIGGFVDPSVDAVVAQKPTLVVLNPNVANKAFGETLQRLKIPTLVLNDGALVDFIPMVERLSQALRRPREGARVKQEFEQAMARVKHAPRALKVLWLYGHRPLVAAGPQSFADDLLRWAGYDNAYRGEQRYPNLSYEAVLSCKPDIVVDVDMGADPDSKLAELSVGRFRYVRVANPALMRLGPRLPEAVASLVAELEKQP